MTTKRHGGRPAAKRRCSGWCGGQQELGRCPRGCARAGQAARLHVLSVREKICVTKVPAKAREDARAALSLPVPSVRAAICDSRAFGRPRQSTHRHHAVRVHLCGVLKDVPFKGGPHGARSDAQDRRPVRMRDVRFLNFAATEPEGAHEAGARQPPLIRQHRSSFNSVLSVSHKMT